QAENSYLSASTLPLIPGSEVVGHTEEGRRVVALTSSGYAEDALGTAPLLRTSTRMAPGESVLVHAGAGGVGTLAIQLAKLWGAGRVIATASSDEKRKLALELGGDAAIAGDPEGLKDPIVEANDGKPVDIVLEMVGGPTFDESFDALGRFGRLVTFGAASPQAGAPIDASRLMKGSKTIAGFWLADCFRDPALLADPLGELFDLTARGKLKIGRASWRGRGEIW